MYFIFLFALNLFFIIFLTLLFLELLFDSKESCILDENSKEKREKRENSDASPPVRRSLLHYYHNFIQKRKIRRVSLEAEVGRPTQ